MTRDQIRSFALENKKLHRVGGFIDVTDYKGAQPAKVTTTIDFAAIDPVQQATVNPIMAKLSADSLLSFDRQIEATGERYYDAEGGVQGAAGVKDTFTKRGGPRRDVTVEYFAHAGWKMPSVICRIAGTGPNKDEKVIIGGHMDSVGGPGADDDGSGTITLFEVLRGLVEGGYVPNRTIELIAYAGEEGGLLGSGEIARAYKANGTKVAAVLQFDMTMFTDGGKNEVVQLVTGGTNKELTGFVDKLFKTYAPGVKTTMVSSVGGSTDSASWTRNGFASAWPFEPVFNKSLHTPKDTYEKLDPAFGLNYAKVGVAFAVEVAEAK